MGQLQSIAPMIIFLVLLIAGIWFFVTKRQRTTVKNKERRLGKGYIIIKRAGHSVAFYFFVAFLVILGLVGIYFAVLHSGILTPKPEPTTISPKPYGPAPNLTISAEIVDSGWVRGDDDLPTYQVTIYYEVASSNWAGEALVRVPTQETPIGIYLERYDRQGRYCKLDYPRGIAQSGAVRFSVTAGSLYAVNDVTINTASLPRSGDNPQILQLYITPNNSYIRQLLAQILANRPTLRSDFGAIQEWVDLNIAYRTDYSTHGVYDYYQLPFETASLRSGDCEDYAILLCSLLRAYGISADEVYVACGCNADGSSCHAYLLEHWYYDEWRVIEPQSSFPLLTDIQSWLTNLEFEDACYFNDQYYFQLK